MKTKRLTATRKTELVETHNIALALARLMESHPTYDEERWKRALYHAISMTDTSRNEREKIRLALELP